MDDPVVAKWIKRSNRKMAKLYSVDNGTYTLIYQDKGKVRLGVVKDGMHTRYGIVCVAAMATPNVLSLWQNGNGACSQAHVEAMQAYFNDGGNLPDFDFATIQGLKD